MAFLKSLCVLSAGAEMTTYPSSAFRDGDEEEDEVAVESVPDDEGLDLKNNNSPRYILCDI
jgi:hypothetical protein